MVKQTFLHDNHVSLGAKMVDFAGWHMPVQYTSIIEEHKTVRDSVGIFDVSHMGEIIVKGKDALAFLNIIEKEQTKIGSIENRLVSVLEEISTQYENLVSSRSTLQDADIADISSEYIRQQILQQASATLLSTANQSPSIALQLI